MGGPVVLFDVLLHGATLGATVFVFWPDIKKMTRDILDKGKGGNPDGQGLRLFYLLFIGSLPTALIGLTLKEQLEAMFSSLFQVGLMLLLTGSLLFFSKKAPMKNKGIIELSLFDVLIVGLAQGIAIAPGISRSGATIVTALFLGFDRELAGKFSFLLSIPAIFGAIVLKLLEDSQSLQGGVHWAPMLLGMTTAGIVGFISLKALMKLVKKGRLAPFSYYCWAVGLLAIVLSF